MATPERKLNVSPAEEEQKFVIDSDNKANWALRKIRKNKEKIKEKEELAQETIKELKKEIRETEEWLEQETGLIKEDNKFFEGLLRQYAEELRKEDEDLKTHKLPFGQLQFRAQRPKWNYDDELLLNSVKNSGLAGAEDEIVKVKEKVNKRKLKGSDLIDITNDGRVVVTVTGEVLEGVTVKDRPEKFKVKVKEG